tara:strand:- start:16666 stop:17208 length:543 start_codon:yes stop_codon:yes gene_type:complete
MNWYKKAKANKQDFSFGEEERAIWRAMIKKEQDFAKISFDLENDSDAGDVRRIKLKTKQKDADEDDTLAVFAQLYHAGGDWESPVGYFRCQLKNNNSWGPKFIFIPSKRQGNANLKKSDDKYMPIGSDDGSYKDINDRGLWKALKKHVEKRAKEFYHSGSDVDEAEEFGMYKWDKALGLV